MKMWMFFLLYMLFQGPAFKHIIAGVHISIIKSHLMGPLDMCLPVTEVNSAGYYHV